MGEPERIDPTSDLYVRNARSHVRAAIEELTGGIEVQEDDAIREQMESTALTARSVENGLSGILDMMRRQAPDAASDSTSDESVPPTDESGETGAAPSDPNIEPTSGLPYDYADSAE